MTLHKTAIELDMVKAKQNSVSLLTNLLSRQKLILYVFNIQNQNN